MPVKFKVSVEDCPLQMVFVPLKTTVGRGFTVMLTSLYLLAPPLQIGRSLLNLHLYVFTAPTVIPETVVLYKVLSANNPVPEMIVQVPLYVAFTKLGLLPCSWMLPPELQIVVSFPALTL